MLTPHIELHMHVAFMFLDINECAEGADGCAQTCTDTEGSYTCSCGVGYELGHDQHGCDGQYNNHRVW